MLRRCLPDFAAQRNESAVMSVKLQAGQLAVRARAQFFCTIVAAFRPADQLQEFRVTGSVH